MIRKDILDPYAGRSVRGHVMLCWRRLDMTGLELLALKMDAAGVSAESTVICAWDGGFQLEHRWRLTPDWRALSLWIRRRDASGERALTLDRKDGGWLVNGERRADLDGADEPDLSVTPFCNTLVIRKVLPGPGARLTVDTAWVNGDDLTVARSSQRYEYQGPGRFRYVDLGVSAGFEADLRVDEVGLIEHYEHLFERMKG